jgi:LPXTG-motif cell wall-anchored protein
MTLLFSANVGGADFVLPAGSSGPGSPGIGSFTWTAGAFETASVTVTIPAEAVPGNYQVTLGCVTPSPDYLHPVDVARPIDFFEITAPAPAPSPEPAADSELPVTGSDSTPYLMGAGLAGIALAAGAGAVALRCRVTAKK